MERWKDDNHPEGLRSTGESHEKGDADGTKAESTKVNGREPEYGEDCWSRVSLSGDR